MGTMPTEAEVLAQIAAGEDQRREFKRAIDNLESVAGELVAFANTEGGRLLVGVEDDGTVVGVSDPAQVVQTLTNICRDRCRPPITPGLAPVVIAGRTVVVVDVEPGLNRQKPYSTQGGRFYLRVGTDKKDATGRELVRIAQSAGELHYDETPVRGAGLDALSPSAFAAYYERQFGLPLADGLQQAGFGLPRLLGNMRLVEALEEAPVLTVAAVLVFAEDPQRFLPQSRLSAVAFGGTDEDKACA